MKMGSFVFDGSLRRGAIVLGLLAACVAAWAQSGTRTVVTNDDLPQFLENSLTFYTVGQGGQLIRQSRLQTGGYGMQGGYFSSARVAITRNNGLDCAYASNAFSGDIAGVVLKSQQVSGNFLGSANDSGAMNGIGVVTNGSYLYAGYSSSNTIGTFAVVAGCGLSFAADVAARGLNGGGPDGMAMRGNMLVVTYEDGSIESFNVASGTPVSNGDLQNSTGFLTDNWPSDVLITKDGHWAILGDNAVFTTVEVADLSSGKIATPTVYDIGTAFNSTNLLLSPDESLLYVVNNASGQITAAFFDGKTGMVTAGCTSPTLKYFAKKWAYSGALATATDSGTGGQLYMSEFGSPSYIGVVNVSSNGAMCTLTEDAQSPVADPNSSALISLSAYTAK